MFVIDSSAVIALVRHERGWEKVEDALLDSSGAGSPSVISAVNMTEVIDKLGNDLPPALFDQPRPLVEPVEYTPDHARAASALYKQTRKQGLSLGDRACLALAKSLALPALTADSAWSDVDAEIEVQLIR